MAAACLLQRRTARRRLGAPCLVLGGLLASGGSGYAERPREIEIPRDLNVILVSIDTLRADHVSTYGDGAQTPHIDGLAAEGVVFERCISQTPLTLPAHVSLLSGTYPLYHRVRDNGGLAVPDRLELLGETLRGHGFVTAAFVGAYVLHSKWGLDQGFDHYSDDFPRSRYARILLQNDKRAEEVVGLATRWIRSHKEERFFAWVHLFDPHTPYDPPAPFDVHRSDPYRGEVEYADAAVGELLDFLRTAGLYDRSLIVLTGDHGESLGEHGEREHGFFVYEPTVWVPLVVRLPVKLPVKRVSRLVEHVDVVPTVLDLLGLPIPAAVQGESLSGVMLGQHREGASVAYTETFYPRLQLGWSELVAFYQDGMKYVRAPRAELYALDGDGEERRDLAAAEPYQSRKRTLEQALDAFVERHGADALDPDPAPVDREDLEALRALGYVTSSAPADGADLLADPKDRIDVFNRLNDAVERFRKGEVEAALAAARGILRAEPGLLAAHVLSGHAYKSQGRFRESAESFERVLELKPDSNFAMIDLLSALIALGEHDQVIEKAPAFLRQFPGDPVLHEELGAAHLLRGDLDAALASFQRAVEISGSALALSRIGEIHARRGDLEKGESYLRRALAADPRSRGAYYTLAQIEEARGRPGEALPLYLKELENDPGNYRASFNAAILLRRQGQLEQAIVYCRKTLESNPAFNVPYFMIAEHYLERGTDLREAIDLCKRGIAVAPGERSALPGYQILLRLLEKTGDRASYELYLAKAKELARDVEDQR